ncbi:hypothetical protein K435DRAFT_880350 [Dendrothele bispora CBS 962.96]|uniref:Uncharacterized protein n=1 Tax=Dendrothele bispora (strain CBS 962.96) TaxID=1314807 RepID=A0A4S8KJK3_DENBC|nr:hypothetical protein K435DRAFT_880350 [Dendrothele bispora CBS 962.96]
MQTRFRVKCSSDDTVGDLKELIAAQTVKEMVRALPRLSLFSDILSPSRLLAMLCLLPLFPTHPFLRLIVHHSHVRYLAHFPFPIPPIYLST